jgi:hypothetical protein
MLILKSVITTVEAAVERAVKDVFPVVETAAAFKATVPLVEEGSFEHELTIMASKAKFSNFFIVVFFKLLLK